MPDEVARMAVDIQNVSQVSVPEIPELSIDAFRNPQEILRYNERMKGWRRSLNRALSQLPLKQETT